jgi:hypothetical protein
VELKVNMKKFLIIVSLVVMTGCTLRVREAMRETLAEKEKQSTDHIVIVPVLPGQKLIAAEWRSTEPNQPAKLWLESRLAEPNEDFGVVIHSEHEPVTGKIIRRFVIVERPLADILENSDEASASPKQGNFVKGPVQ